MAIRVNDDGTVTVTNGDVTILRQIQADYHVKSPEDMLGFILNIAANAKGRPLGFITPEGSTSAFKPSDKIIVRPDSSTPPVPNP
jgi:hypothetical protein